MARCSGSARSSWQEALGPGAPAFPGNMYVPINRLKPIFQELVANGRLSTPPRPWLGLLTSSIWVSWWSAHLRRRSG